MQNAGMPTFLEQHADKVLGALSCFDRTLLRGYLPLESGWTMPVLAGEHFIHRFSNRELREKLQRLCAAEREVVVPNQWRIN